MRTALVIFFAFFVIGLASLSIGGSRVYAMFDNAWLDYPASIIARNSIEPPDESRTCSGVLLSIKVVGNGEFKDACTYGDLGALRVARFFTGTAYLYAVAFPGDEQYYEVRGGCPLSRCVYASGSDTLISHKNITPYVYGGVIYKNFSQHLERRFDAAKNSSYFRFAVPSPDYTVMMGTYQPAVESVALSNDGRWALFELRGYGIVRLNVTTLEARRISAPGADYGLGHDPTYELAISNDGRDVVATGKGVGLQFVHVNDTCGDYLVEGLQPRYASNIISCPWVSMGAAGLPHTYDYFTKPRFDASGGRLGFTIRYRDATAERIIMAPANTTLAGRIDYLALGDSFTSGEGELQDSYYRLLSTEEPTRCHVSARSYPYLLGSLWGSATESVACSGARTVDILRSSSYAGQGSALLEVSLAERQQLIKAALEDFRSGVIAQEEFASTYQPQVITVGIGGNDAGLVGKLGVCLGIDTCEWANDPAKRYATAKEIAALYPKIQQVIEALRNDSPQSHILMVGYPQIINAAPNAPCDIVTGLLLNAEERVFMRETIQYLNQVIKAAAYAQNVAFADIEQSFSGHELCQGQNTSAMNGVRFGGDIAPIKALSEFRIFGAESFHPTPVGHKLTAQLLFGRYPSLEAIEVCGAGCESKAQVPEPNAYWQPEHIETTVVQQRYDPLMAKGVIKPGELLRIATSPLQFMPGSPVKVELHSNPRVLSEENADEKGALVYDAIIPLELRKGYHTLHLLGISAAGEPIDLYRTITVANERDEQSNSTTVGASSAKFEVKSTHSMNTELTPQSLVLRGTSNKEGLPQILGVIHAMKREGVADAPRKLDESQHTPLGGGYTLLWIGIIAAGIGAGIFSLSARWHSHYSSRNGG